MNQTERGAHVRFPPPLVYVIWILLGVVVGRLAVPAPVPLARTFSLVLGLVVLAAGVILVLLARAHFVRTGQNPIPWTPSPTLILQGPYRFTRNPMYVGVTLIQIGIGLAVNNLWISAFAIPALAIVHATAVLPEERYLTQKFGESYRTYLGQVRRYL